MTSLLERIGATTDGSPEGSRRRRRFVVIAVVAVLVLALVVWLLFFSSVFAAKTVKLTGVEAGDRAAVLKAAAVDQSVPLLRQDTDGIRSRVEALPYVASASVHISFPSTLVIDVTPRIAVGYLKTDDGYALVDKTGKQFRTRATAPGNVPKFVLPTGATARSAGAAVAEVAQSLSTTMLATVASIEALDPNAITVLLRDSRVIHWGSAADSAQKAAVLPALLAQKGSVYDVSNPDQVFVH